MAAGGRSLPVCRLLLGSLVVLGCGDVFSNGRGIAVMLASAALNTVADGHR